MKKTLNNVNLWIVGLFFIFTIPMVTASPLKMIGDSFADTHQGTEGDDYLEGSNENDNIESGDGDDFNVGGDGDDNIESGEGNDSLMGNEGADEFNCGDGEDVILDYNEEEGDKKSDDCESF